MLINGPIHAGSGSFYNFNLLSTGQVLQASTGAAGIQTTHTSGTVTTKGGLQVVTFRDAGSPVTLQNAVATGTAICGTSTGGVGSGNCVGPLQIETRLANGTTATFAAGDIKYNSINGTNIFGVGTAADVVFVGPSQTVSNGSINGRNVFFYAEGSDKNAADGTGKITLNVLIKNGDINNGQSGGSLNLIADGSIVLDGSATTENALIGQRTTSNNGNTVTITYFDHNLKLVATKDIEVKGSIYLVGDLSLRANAGQSEVQALASNPASSKGTLGGNVNITRPNDYQFPVELRATNITIGDATGAFGVNNVNLTSGNMSFTGNGTRSGDVLLIATGAFNANFAGDFNLTGGTATAASGGSGTTAKVTSISGVQAANMFIRGVGTSPRQLANLNVKGGSATSTANGGGALATADAILLSTGTKTIIVDGDMNIIGGSTFAGSQGVKPANAGQASAAAIVDPIRLTITTGGDLTLESGKVGTNNQANLQSSGEIVLNVRNLFLKGAPGSGLFTGSGQALSGPPYNLPIEVNLKGGQVVITQSSIYGSVATVKSDVTPVYDGLLNYIIYAANEETRAARIRAGLGAGDDSNLPSCQ